MDEIIRGFFSLLYGLLDIMVGNWYTIMALMKNESKLTCNIQSTYLPITSH